MQLSLKTAGDSIDVGIVIAWQAGARIEMGTSLRVTAIVSESDSQGDAEYVLPFVFKDPFQNKGNGKIVISGRTAKLSLDVTEIEDSRAARQYGDYSLTRTTSP